MIGRLVMGHVGGYVTFSYGTFRYGMKSNAKFRVWDLLYRTAVYSIQCRGFFSSSCEVLTLLYTVLYEEQSRQQICQILCTIYQCITDQCPVCNFYYCTLILHMSVPQAFDYFCIHRCW